MKKFLLSVCLMASFALPNHAVQIKENLNRAPVAVTTSQGVLVSWRYLSSDGNATFSVYRNGTKIADNISTKTNYLDASGKSGDTYKIVSSNGGEATATAWSSMYKTLSVKRPSAIKTYDGSGTGHYRPDDMSVADLDGDGDYELVLKWMPDNAQDNGAGGFTSPCIFSAYEMDGTPLWSKDINLGYSIRTGNHYSPFLVYDLDGDGKAELVCKTGCDSRDGNGNLVSSKGDAIIQAVGEKTNLKLSSGHVTGGEEFLTVFNGATGAAMNTIWYNPSRSREIGATQSTKYGDWESVDGKSTNYNRGERYNAAVAYLDGTDKLPSAIMERGYYNYCYLWAVDWNGTQLSTRWVHCGLKGGWRTVDANNNTLYQAVGSSSFGQGVHGISVADVNGDGFDDICTGGATIGHDGQLLCSTGKGHGDAIHLADLVPSRPGLEVMMPHEESPYGYDVHDATTGELLVYETGSEDNGRGIAGDFIPSNANSVCWSATAKYATDCGTGKQVSSKYSDTNFRIYWTGDPFDQTFDGRYDKTSGKSAPRICVFNNSGSSVKVFQEFSDFGNPSSCNTTKATPCLQADILGDWREEIIMYKYEADFSASNCDLLIYTTPEPTNYKVPCLMEDHVYRMGIVWQNSAYNQPPHLGYNLANSLAVNRATYTTATTGHAVKEQADPEGPLTEKLAAPGSDKDAVTGICYTAGANGELTASTSGSYIKMRTGNNDQIVFTVNKGYVITGINISGYSNNTSKTADRSITLTGITVDGATSVLSSPVIFPGGTAGQSPVTVDMKDFTATQNIVLSFDNSKIVSSDVDSAGKNKQIYAIITFTYTTTAGIHSNVLDNYSANTVKVFSNGRIVILNNGKMYNTTGQRLQ